MLPLSNEITIYFTPAKALAYALKYFYSLLEPPTPSVRLTELHDYLCLR